MFEQIYDYMQIQQTKVTVPVFKYTYFHLVKMFTIISFNEWKTISHLTLSVGTTLLAFWGVHAYLDFVFEFEYWLNMFKIGFGNTHEDLMALLWLMACIIAIITKILEQLHWPFASIKNFFRNLESTSVLFN